MSSAWQGEAWPVPWSWPRVLSGLLALLLAGILSLAYLTCSFWDEARWALSTLAGARTEGLVTLQWTEEQLASCVLGYHYDAVDRTGIRRSIYATAALSRSACRRLEAGGRVSLAYLPGFPDISYPSAPPPWQGRWHRYGYLVIASPLAILAYLLARFGRRHAFYPLRFRLRSRLAPGRITRRWKRDSAGYAVAWVSYSFVAHTADGLEQAVHQTERSRWAYAQLDTDDRVVVRYLPADPLVCLLEPPPGKGLRSSLPALAGKVAAVAAWPARVRWDALARSAPPAMRAGLARIGLALWPVLCGAGRLAARAPGLAVRLIVRAARGVWWALARLVYALGRALTWPLRVHWLAVARRALRGLGAAAGWGSRTLLAALHGMLRSAVHIVRGACTVAVVLARMICWLALHLVLGLARGLWALLTWPLRADWPAVGRGLLAALRGALRLAARIARGVCAAALALARGTRWVAGHLAVGMPLVATGLLLLLDALLIALGRLAVGVVLALGRLAAALARGLAALFTGRGSRAARIASLVTLLLVGLVVARGLGWIGPRPRLSILAASEARALEPLVREFARQERYDIRLTYQDSVDIMVALEQRDLPYDAVWPAHNLWIALGDAALRRARTADSVARTPVVFGIRMSLARELGFVGREVTVGDILSATESGKLRFMMPNPTQSNSGAVAYLGFIYSFLGQPDIISREDLRRPELVSRMRSLLRGVSRTAGSSQDLVDLYLHSPDAYDAMVADEAAIIALDRELAARGLEPLYVVYPVDGQAIADYPLADMGRADALAPLQGLRAYLLGDAVQDRLVSMGWRAGLLGLGSGAADTRAFIPAWGLDPARVVNQIPLPRPEVIREALDLYQLELRRPSLTVFCLDYSGSMQDSGSETLQQAMSLLLTQESARQWMVQTGPEDVTVVIPYNSQPLDTWIVEGNGQQELDALLRSVRNVEPQGGTDIYLPVMQALQIVAQRTAGTGERYQLAVVLLTDGKSNTDGNWPALQRAWASLEEGVPVYGILFGDADPAELQRIAGLSGGAVYDGRNDLRQAFRQVRGATQ